MQWSWRHVVYVAVVGYLLSDIVFPPTLDASLSGKVAVVTGGSRGSGRGFAQGLSEAGVTVYITGRTLASLQEACRSVPGPGTCIPKVLDSADDAALEAFFAELSLATDGRLDILVNNAYSGVGSVTPPHPTPRTHAHTHTRTHAHTHSHTHTLWTRVPPLRHIHTHTHTLRHTGAAVFP